MNSLKLAFVGAVLASTALACSAGPTESAVEADVDSDQINVACVKGGGLCGGTGGPRTGGRVVIGGLVVAPIEPPVAGPTFTCAGPGPEGGGAVYRVLGTYDNKQCWSSTPVVIQGAIPYGFAMLSLYICPSTYPVNRCDPYGRCTCWSY